jgi:hypothetical protein
VQLPQRPTPPSPRAPRPAGDDVLGAAARLVSHRLPALIQRAAARPILRPARQDVLVDGDIAVYRARGLAAAFGEILLALGLGDALLLPRIHRAAGQKGDKGDVNPSAA